MQLSDISILDFHFKWNIFHDESHIESQEPAVINPKEKNGQEDITITIDLHFERCLSYKNIFDYISLHYKK